MRLKPLCTIVYIERYHNFFFAHMYIDGSDYTASSATLSFDTMMQCLEVPLIDNSVVEDDESFSVMITNTPAMLTASPSSTSVIIEDDDCKLELV